MQMSKIAIVILTDTEGGEALGRVVNALTAAQEFQEGGDEVQVIFTGAGTKWVGELAKPDHKLHGTYTMLKGCVAGACGYCAGAFGVADTVQSAGVCLLNDYGTNMSFRKLVKDAFQVITF
jgi:hypothetical protein